MLPQRSVTAASRCQRCLGGRIEEVRAWRVYRDKQAGSEHLAVLPRLSSNWRLNGGCHAARFRTSVTSIALPPLSCSLSPGAWRGARSGPRLAHVGQGRAWVSAAQAQYSTLLALEGDMSSRALHECQGLMPLHLQPPTAHSHCAPKQPSRALQRFPKMFLGRGEEELRSVLRKGRCTARHPASP
jgi:hypothetical protein